MKVKLYLRKTTNKLAQKCSLIRGFVTIIRICNWEKYGREASGEESELNETEIDRETDR